MKDGLLTDFLALEIPTVKVPPDGFLEIIGLSHYETINSRIYSYFLDQEKNENISSLFIYSLAEIILEKTGKSIIIDTFEVFTEVSTTKGRIDIVIEDCNNKSVIIIENKIYHHLNNPLLDYWKHYKYKNKLGIILTLKP
ncbi:PD-(D/E)XK nuclease family protein [uncultured Kordia sp.]|uniref:PD-(D/E)XK nuclease family protein n=1 Tax=uncultured Kordia sp. TaxID=507699 RepID=UPI002622C231|nr:PD-(D/E)XK nuclease family protein [uncultured Kordia sp.]